MIRIRPKEDESYDSIVSELKNSFDQALNAPSNNSGTQVHHRLSDKSRLAKWIDNSSENFSALENNIDEQEIPLVADGSLKSSKTDIEGSASEEISAGDKWGNKRASLISDKTQSLIITLDLMSDVKLVGPSPLKVTYKNKTKWPWKRGCSFGIKDITLIDKSQAINTSLQQFLDFLKEKLFDRSYRQVIKQHINAGQLIKVNHQVKLLSSTELLSSFSTAFENKDIPDLKALFSQVAAEGQGALISASLSFFGPKSQSFGDQIIVQIGFKLQTD